jgi:Concanavalin A-like lectin/glucanases superfamily
LPASCTLTPTQPCQESLDGGFSSYTMWVVSLGSKIQITSSGSYNGLIRTVQLLVTQPVLSSGLVGWWKFDDGSSGTCSGSVADSSGNVNTGTCVNSLAWTTGKFVNALSFNSASSQYVSTTTNVGNPAVGFSISAWFNTTSASGTKIVGLEDAQTGTGGVSYDRHLYMGTDGKIYFGVVDTTYTLHAVTSLSTLNDGVWHHAVGTNNGTTSTLYIDGASQGTTSGGAYNLYSTSYWRIGSYKLNFWPNGVDGYFNGSIDDVRVYNRVLSASEVSKIYSLGEAYAPVIELTGPSIVYGSRKEI